MKYLVVGSGLYGAVFRHLPRCAAIHDRRGGAGQGAGLRGDAVPPPPGAAGAEIFQTLERLLFFLAFETFLFGTAMMKHLLNRISPFLAVQQHF